MICIPRGGRYATVVNVARSNLGCDARFEAASLPRGVSLRVPPIPRSTSSFPVLFEAAADAPVDGGWHAFAIHSAGDNAPPVSGPLVEEVHHIEINNQGAYHSTRSEKIAVAVTEPAPFSLVVDAPPAPLVARGMLRLGAHLQRAEGFDAPVTLRMLWNPPGIGSPTTVRIDQGKSEAGYEINANPDAPVAEWQVCVLAEADTPDGPVIVSSELVPLRVVDPWVSASIDLGATEQGRNVPVLCKLEQHREFPGKARAELLGLPHGATTQAVEFDKDTGEITFPVEVAADAAVALVHQREVVGIAVGKGNTVRRIGAGAVAQRRKHEIGHRRRGGQADRRRGDKCQFRQSHRCPPCWTCSSGRAVLARPLSVSGQA